MKTARTFNGLSTQIFLWFWFMLLLVVAAVVAYLVKSGNQRFTKWIYLGVLAGLAGSGLIAVLFTFLFGGSGPVQEISEGVCALIAMLMLLWTSNWMLNKSSVEAWNRYIRTKTESAVADAQNKVEAGQRRGPGHDHLARHAELPSRVP